MEEDKVCNQIIQIYLKLYLKYKGIGIGNKTSEGYLVTKEAIQRFSKRLQKYLALQ